MVLQTTTSLASVGGDNPWLRIPADDYEAHMCSIGQSAVLRDFFCRAYKESSPTRLAILGCTTGSDLRHIDPTVTAMVAGVDINPAYIEIARARFTTLGSRLRLVNGDVMEVDLPAVQFDLVHAALLLEYVEPLSLLRRIHQWLSPEGICSVVTQEPIPGGAEVSSSGFNSLEILAGRMCLRSAEEVVALAAEVGFRLVRQRAMTLPNGKSLVNSIFEKARWTESGDDK